ncbi:MAG TPA: sugar ABC transporter ATP-binding protein [Thermomicrobiales bacterium]|nr:sugar ABC transporter ATP-binding protein [Thermomicrobiales bacterium]
MPLLEATGIDKRFGGVIALHNADFSCEAGEIHALLGENGAGKSTMIKVLCGVQQPDAGTITYEGQPKRFSGPSSAIAAGIVPVFQELSLVPDLTVAQNLVLGREPRNRIGLIDQRRMRRDAERLFTELGFSGVDPSAEVRDLPLSDRQLVEIAKALSHDPRVLILDEATSALSRHEVDQVFTVIRRLRDRGIAVIFISHRMEEVQEICDRATVFRDGTSVGTVVVAKTPPSEIVQMMIGRPLHETFPPRVPRPEPVRPLLEVRDLSWGHRLRHITFDVNPGEIVGLSGLEGQGQADLLFALFGVYAGVHGTITLDGQKIGRSGPTAAMRGGLALVPEDRKTQGLVLPMSVGDNLIMATLPELSTGGLISPERERQASLAMRERLEIKIASLDAPVRYLSGGNQQKVAIAKWLMTDAKVYLFSDPTRGIDVGAKREIYDLMRELTAAGRGIIFFSTDLTEIVGLCDRALVMYEGTVVRELGGAELTDANLIEAAVGLASQPHATGTAMETS